MQQKNIAPYKIGAISQCNLTVKSPDHNWVYAGSNPATATKRGDSVMANMTVSKTVDLSSNLSPCANCGAVGKLVKPPIFQVGVCGFKSRRHCHILGAGIQIGEGA